MTRITKPRRSPADRLKDAEQAFNRAWPAEWQRRKSAFVHDVWLHMMRDQSMQRIYGYYCPSQGMTWGEFLYLPQGAEVPEGYQLIDPEPIPSGPELQIACWLDQRAKWLPMLPVWGTR